MVVGALASVVGLLAAYSAIRGIAMSDIPNRNSLLIILPAVFLSLPLSLLLSNCVLFVVPPLRRVAERFVAEAHRPGFLESQRGLLVALGVVGIICVPLIVLGFWL
jgi:hypothetical protein